MEQTTGREKEESFVSFFCPSCRQEIEAETGFAGQQSECPSCGAKITIPAKSEPGTSGNPFSGDQGPTPAQLAAMKSRTIRIELDGI